MKTESKIFYIGTAGWNLPHESRQFFSPLGSHLERYASIFNAVEINSSFYRIHRTDTYAKWASMVPKHFRFSVKLLKQITHERRLQPSIIEVKEALVGPLALKEKLGVLLVQLPPSLEFERKVVVRFFEQLRSVYSGYVAIEPRHLTWISGEAKNVLAKYCLSLVFADPKCFRVPEDLLRELGGFYYARLHGSPLIYKSKYPDEALRGYAQGFRAVESNGPVWCVFDNTTFGYATTDALDLKKMLTPKISVATKNKHMDNEFSKPLLEDDL